MPDQELQASDRLLTAPPKSVQVADLLRNEIRDLGLRPGARLQPARALAERFTVSKQVIQSAFAILEREGTIASHVGRGTFVAPKAKALNNRTVLLLLHGTYDKHDRMPVILPSVLQKHGYIPCIFDARRGHEPASIANIRELLREKPRACIVTAYGHFNLELLDAVDPRTQLIFVRHFEGKKDYPAAYVLEDFREGGRRAAAYLLDKGRTRIAAVSYERQPGWSCDLLLRGAEEVLAARGLKLRKCLDALTDETTFLRGFAKGGTPDGIFCISDFYYERVSRAAARHGLLLGRDFDAVGYGDTPWASAYGIASVNLHDDLLAERVVEVLENRQDVRIQICPELRCHRSGEHHGPL